MGAAQGQDRREPPLVAATRCGALTGRLRIAIAGGAAPGQSGTDFFAIGKRNLTAVRKWLWQSGLLVAGEEPLVVS